MQDLEGGSRGELLNITPCPCMRMLVSFTLTSAPPAGSHLGPLHASCPYLAPDLRVLFTSTFIAAPLPSSLLPDVMDMFDAQRTARYESMSADQLLMAVALEGG